MTREDLSTKPLRENDVSLCAMHSDTTFEYTRLDKLRKALDSLADLDIDSLDSKDKAQAWFDGMVRG